jgi:nitroreductase
LEAPAAIIVCGDSQGAKYKEYWNQDCAAATQNILLTIDELGLGGVWLGVYPREDRIHSLQKLFSLPNYIIPFSIVALGKPKERKPPNDRFLNNRIKWNTWE